MSRISVLPSLDAGNYQCSELHSGQRVWLEKNCYVDIWIEVIHALGLNPLAVMPFTISIDFEGDQWTFFKPPHEELRSLYGIDVQELNVWRPLLEHAAEHLAGGKLISTEADAYWLPDTSGTDYKTQHTKTTIVLAELDQDARRLGYFHNASYFELAGEDYEQIFRIARPVDPSFMPLFAELVRVDRLIRRPASELAEMSLISLRRHLARIPVTNPVARFKLRFRDDLSEIESRGLAYYHSWAFGTIRQLGSATELAALYLRWVSDFTAFHSPEAASAFERISTTCKALILKAARAVNARRPLDFDTSFGSAEADWALAMEHLSAAAEQAA